LSRSAPVFPQFFRRLGIFPSTGTSLADFGPNVG
jgi:hypothetical protein